MRYKKHMIILLAAIFLFAMATASAADLNDTAVAAEDRQLTDEIIQASENQENTIQASNNDELNLSEDDSGKLAISNDKTLGTGTDHTFQDIQNAITGGESTIYLEPGKYTGNSYIFINGKSNIKIIGDSTILDAQNKTRIFYISQSSNITIQNIIFKNGYTGSDGGAIYVFDSCRDCIISNCTFINNHAHVGGAICWAVGSDNGRVSNCTFINNTAKGDGGAICWINSEDGRVNNCTFINNTAEGDGDAIHASACDLNADYNWFGNTADNYNDQLPINRYVKCDYRLFLNATANPGTITGKDTSNVTFKLYQYHSGVVSDYDNAPFKNLDLTITATKGNVKGTAKLDEPIQFTPTGGGTASVTATVENVRQTVEINVKGDFDLLQDLVNNESLSIINLERNYTYNEFDTITDGVRINRPITINGNGFTIDAKGKSRIFRVTAGSINITNVTLKNGKADNGGAIYFENAISNSNINATFINNTATGGGANFFFSVSDSNVTGTYTNNNATNGGANYFLLDVSGSKITGTYTNNTATWGGANSFVTVSGSNVTGIYTSNTATYDGGANYFEYSVSDSNITGTYINNTAGGAIIYFDVFGEAILTNVTIENAIFLNNKYDENMGVIYAEKTGVVAKNNWFGNNATNFETQPKATNLQMDSWLFLNGTNNQNNINFFLMSYDGTTPSEHDNTLLPKINLTVTTTDGILDKSVVGLDETVKFSPAESGISRVAAQIEDAAQTIEFSMGDFNILQGVINNASENSVINLTRNYTYNQYDTMTDGVLIDKNVTINGNGFTIDAKGKSRIFKAEASEVTISNLAIKNANCAGDGGAIYFAMNSIGSVINCNFTNNQATGDLSCGGAIYFRSNGNVTNCKFTNNSAKYGGAIHFAMNSIGNVTNCNFINNNATDDGGAVYFYFYSTYTVENCNFTNNSASSEGGAIYSADRATGEVTNCKFTNNSAKYGGAIEFSGTGTVTNCNFTNNIATYYSGAVFFLNTGTVEDCNFVNNNATDDGGAVYFLYPGTVENCNFTGNNATTGSAIYFYSSSSAKTVSNSTFLNNRANAESLEVTKNENNITIIFTGNDNLLNAIYSNSDVTFSNVTYWGANGITNTNSYTPTRSNREAGQNITVGVVVNDIIVLNEVKVTDENGTIVLDINVGENYYILVRHDIDTYYTGTERPVSNMTYNVNVTSQTTNNKTVNITAKSNIPQDIVQGKLLFILPNGENITANYAGNGAWWAEHTFDDYANYQVNASYIALSNVTVTNATISIVKANSTVNVTSVVLNYGESKEVTVTTTGATGITAKIDNDPVTVIDNYTIPFSGLDAGNYTLTVTTIADDNHNTVNKTIKVTVNPASSGLEVNGTDIFFGNDAILNYTAVNATGINMSISDWRGNALKEGVDYNITITDSQIIIRFFDDGTCTVNVTALTDDNHVPTSRNVTVHVNPICDLEVILTPMNLTANYGDTITWNATIISHGPSYPFNVNLYAYAQEGLIFKNAYSDSNYYYSSIPFTLYPNIPLYVFLKTLVNASNVNLTLNVSVRDEYFPDPNPDNNNASATVEIEYVKADLNITAPSQITVGDSASVEVALPEDATGNITVKVDGQEITTVSLINGSANVELSDLNAGNHTVEIIYSGDEKYSPANETKEITVSKQDTTAEVTIPANITVGDDANVNVKLPGDATGNVTLKLDGETVDTVPVTNGTANITIPSLTSGNHTVEITYSGDDKYNPVSETKEITVSKQDVTPEIAVDDANVNVKLPSDATGNVTVKVDDTAVSIVPVTNGTASVKLPKLSAGNHTVEISYSGDDKYNPSTKTATVSVDMDTTILTAKNVTATYNVNKYLTITLTDSNGSPIADATVSVKLKSTKNYTTNAKGQIKVKVSKLVPKTYIAQITFKGNDKYAESSATAKVKVKKATSKITAKSMSIKQNTQTKYTVKLTSNGKAVKNAKVYLIIGKKKYSATTGNNGKATFNIKLSKTGTFNAVIKFKENKFYKKATKKVKITVKPVWKTVYKYSSDKKTVEEIQWALKHNGYYITYNGYQLVVDGYYGDCTERSVKEFQTDKKLDATGSVDYKTAQKLEII